MSEREQRKPGRRSCRPCTDIEESQWEQPVVDRKGWLDVWTERRPSSQLSGALRVSSEEGRRN